MRYNQSHWLCSNHGHFDVRGSEQGCPGKPSAGLRFLHDWADWTSCITLVRVVVVVVWRYFVFVVLVCMGGATLTEKGGNNCGG